MTKEEVEKVLEIIREHFHIFYVEGYPKLILTTDALLDIENELDELVSKRRKK